MPQSNDNRLLHINSLGEQIRIRCVHVWAAKKEHGIARTDPVPKAFGKAHTTMMFNIDSI